MDDANILKAERLQKLNDLRGAGINPYPYTFNHTHHAVPLLEKYASLDPEGHTKDVVNIAGRIVQLRRMGKVTFMHIQDQTGRIQGYFRKDDIGDTYTTLKKLDLGDIIGISGEVFKTKMGEVSVYVRSFEILCKAILPLPDKYHGLKDVELRYRKRYLDLVTNPEVKDVFFKRSKIIAAIRDYLHEKGFIEVETPLLQTIYGGANARPFVTHINAWNMDMYLSVSPELYLKRLLVGGFEKVFTICKNFRNEGVDRSHNPEFTMLEAYQLYVDYNTMMELTEGLYEHVCKTVFGKTKVSCMYKGEPVDVDFKAPWKRLTLKQALKDYLDLDVDSMSDDELKNAIRGYNIELEGDYSRGAALALLFDELVEDRIIQPTHVIDRPKEASPLCKLHRDDPELIEQNEPICCGMEMGNMYSELNDPILQRKVLEAQADQLRAGFEEAQPMDEDFVEAIEQGMPPAGGLGIGIDRMVLFLTGQPSVRDIILFPTMKPEIETVQEQEARMDAEMKAALTEKGKVLASKTEKNSAEKTGAGKTSTESSEGK